MNHSGRKKSYTRIEKSKKRKRRILAIMITISLFIFLFIGGSITTNAYLSYRCKDLTYAIDHYFTNSNDYDLRINYVQSMEFIDKSDDSATVEVFGLSPTEPPERTTLVGDLSKNEDGTWILSKISKKD